MSQGIRWAFNIKDWKPTKSQWKLCLQCVQKEEVERCDRFHFVDDCKSSLVGQLLMRKAVSETLSVEYDKIVFARTSSGKPYLLGENENRIFFNVSHNGDFCVLASEISMPIGVDVMKVHYRGTKDLPSYFEMMKRQFSRREWDFISIGCERKQLQRFYRLWCLKESYLKAVGTGIVCDLSTVDFSCETPSLNDTEIATDTKLYKDGLLQDNWKFEESIINGNHCVAVALDCSKEAVNQSPKYFDVIDFEELMRSSKPFVEVDEKFWENFTSKKGKTFGPAGDKIDVK